ncbi:LysR family transcriptional regulator [Crossiella cryophila]|uniref:DNA-binding transcriptional LysR family regulator n=1 Tax=Crossiella cryophila TaxID=43355 RepID=A0A7W7CBQ0_9PSEU|nr:LysR family transcriptional regulator [Crossiella cryophila]MBB4676639.1 DNA-binding transcriptional LysR family regulator [Crossiella cryophila]
MDVELRHFRCFLAIAEEGSVTAAAARLHLTQPAVSRTLGQLEQRLGRRLVDRSTRHLRLTADGEAFADRARAVLAAVAAALDPGPEPPLRVGYAWAAAGPHTTAILRAWRERRPEVPLEIRRFDERTAGLGRGEVDVALLRTEVTDPRLHSCALYLERRYAALAADHPLAERPELTLRDLGGLPIARNELSGTTTPELWPTDAPPGETVRVHNVDEWLTVIAAGRAVGVTADGTRHHHMHAGVAYVPLSGVPPVTVYLAWPAGHRHPRLTEFLALTREIVRS